MWMVYLELTLLDQRGVYNEASRGINSTCLEPFEKGP